ncbi:hypothetical protein E1B13_23565 [Salmonella enterica subsp. enterica]|nr:hypothetical protein [Salmonella enterica subsp. enterica]
MYTEAGLDFGDDGNGNHIGRSREMKASKLIVLSSWKKENGGNIILQDIDDYMKELLKENESLKREMENNKLKIDSLNQKLLMMERKTMKGILSRMLKIVIKYLSPISKKD